MAASAKGGAETHESFVRVETAAGSSDRAFGMVFAVVLLAVGLWPLPGGGAARLWALGLALLLVLAAAVRPKVLAPANRLWTRFGLLLHRLTGPIVMALVFFLAVTPTALIMRAMGKDSLRRRIDPAAQSYWIERRPPGPAPESIKRQF